MADADAEAAAAEAEGASGHALKSRMNALIARLD
jgi:hypothetical protein